MKSILAAFDGAQTIQSHGRRLEEVVKAARAVRDALLAERAVDAVRTLPLTHLPYPTQYAFQGAGWSPVPFVQMAHRSLCVQFQEAGASRTLLFNPTDIIAARRTPFFADFIRKVGPFERFLAPRSTPLTAQLTALGVNPEDVDYVAFDHFHTQDLRPVLARFPRATLLAPRTEWDDW